MNLQTLIVCALICGVYAYMKRQRVEPEEPEEPPYFDALELSDAVRELKLTMERLENANRMQTDICTCEPETLHRYFRAQWVSSDGKNRTIDLCATGQGRLSHGLEEAARAERDRLNQEAIDRIRALAAAIETGDPAQISVFAPFPCEVLPADLSGAEITGQSGKYSGTNDDTGKSWGSGDAWTV